jgi:hypothetical protein
MLIAPSAQLIGSSHAENRILILRTNAVNALTEAEITGYNLRNRAEKIHP